MIVFPSLDELRTRRSSKWRLYESDVLPMPVAEMDVALAEPIAATLHAAVDRSDTGYPAMDGAVQEAFVGFAARRWGWDVPVDQTRLAIDVSVAAVEVLRTALEPGSTVLVSSPVYPPFHQWPGTVGMHLRDVPMAGGAESGWRLDLPAIEAAFAAGARGYVLCHPHNPLGHLHSPDDLAGLADIADRYQGLVIADEIHAPLTLPGHSFVPYLSVSEAARRTGVALHSASKAWNLAGLKSAFIVTDHPDAAARLAGLPREMPWHSGHFGAMAAVTAYQEAEPWLDELLVILAANQRTFADLLAKELPGARYRPGQAGYLAWVDLRDLDWGENPAAHTLRLGRLALGIGHHFGQTGRGHVRVNLGCAPELVPEAVRRLVVTGQALDQERR